MSEEDSIKPVIPQDFSVPIGQSLAQAVASAMAALPADVTPRVVVDSPLAAWSLRSALAQTGWPGRSEGAPLPWCGTLEQAFDDVVTNVVTRAVQQGRPIGGITLPRPIAMRRVQLAQALLDFKGIAQSLGGSSKAALDLAGQWVDLFEGWEWCSQRPDHLNAEWQASHLQSDLATLRELQAANAQPNDRVAWMVRHAPQAADMSAGGTVVWFCLARQPSPQERAMAEVVWTVTPCDMSVWMHASVRLPVVASAPRTRLAAKTLEESAWMAVQTLLQWRAQGMDDIGVVALDRKIVRRMRSLLERAGEPISDRSGWALDTTVAATAVSGLNDLLTGQGTTQSILEWVQSPFVRQGLFARFGFDAQAVERLDQSLRDFGRIVSVDVGALMDQGLLPMTRDRLSVRASRGRASMATWASALMSALEHCGMDVTLAADHAGQAVLAALQRLQAEAGAESTASHGLSSSLWQAVLAEELNRARFVEPVPQAQIRVVSLSSLTWQCPKAVLIVGADTTRLPQQTVPQFFEPQRYAEMGLQNPPLQVEQERFAQFAALWAAPLPMAILACSEKPDSEVEFSNWVEVLAQDTPIDATRAITPMPLQMNLPGARADRPPIDAPNGLSAWPYALPRSLTVSQMQSLANCPYQFVLQQAMGLTTVDDLTEHTEPSDLGSVMHLVVKGARQPFVSEAQCAQWLAQEIDRTLATPFFAANGADAPSLPMPQEVRNALRADALALVPELAKWLATRPAAITEHSVVRLLESIGVELRGRIDRWERGHGPEGGDLLIDFKTTDPAVLQKRVGPEGSDVQLPLYAWLLAADAEHPRISDVRYVSLRRETVKEVGFPSQPISELVENTVAQLSERYAALAQGAPMDPAGVRKAPEICDHCSVRGVCRRDEVPHGR